VSATAASQLVEIHAADWDVLLEGMGAADAYLRRGYVEASALLEPGRPVFLALRSDEGSAVFAVIVRDIPDAPGLADAIVPYGYGGPLVQGSDGDAVAARFYALYDSWCREHRVVTTFIRFHPLFENRRSAPPEIHVERLTRTASWRLDPDRDLFAGMHQMHRRGVRKALREGLNVRFIEGPARLDEFAALYEDAMRRLGAQPFYFFPREYWTALAGGLGPPLVLVEVRAGGELVAGLLLLATRPWLHYHLGATSPRGFALGGSKLAFFEAARWGQGRGFAELHLGTGRGAEESTLLDFKRRFSPRDLPREFWVGKLVHDRDAYRALADVDTLEGFFPAYRAAAR
jgi:serine/alanine adding enzyme